MDSGQLAATKVFAGFDRRQVVADASLEIERGEIVALAGPNGAGKSTLVKTLARQLRPVAGTVTLGGKEIWALSAAAFASQVAYVPQTLDPGQDLTVEELVSLGRNPHQRWWQWHGSMQDRAAVESALAATQMLAHRRTCLSWLSGGERQRAAMATALAQEPNFMLLDEPTSHLDFGHQLDLLSQLKELKARSIGCLVVLHDLNLISRIADRVVLLQTSPGKPSSIGASGLPPDVLTRQNLCAVFNVEIHIFKDPESGEPVFNPVKRCTLS